MTSVDDVTVVMAVFNDGERIDSLLSHCLEVLSPATIVVVDDGSSDDTRERLVGWSSAVDLLFVDHVGLGGALNAGIDCVRTRFVARMDADDRSIPGRLRAQAAWLRERPYASAVGTDYVIRQLHSPNRRVSLGDTEDLWRMLRIRNVLAHGSMMLRTDMVRAAGGYRVQFTFAQDYDLWLRLARLGPIGNIGEPLFERWLPSHGLARWKQRRQARYAARGLADARARGQDIPLSSVIRHRLRGIAY